MARRLAATKSREILSPAIAEPLILKTTEFSSFQERLEFYQAADRRLAGKLTSAETLEDLIQAFLEEPDGSLHHCGIPTLSPIELRQVSTVLVQYLRKVSAKSEVQRASCLPLTLKRAAWKLLTQAEKAYIRQLLQRGATP